LLHGVSPPFLYALSPRSSAGSTDAEFGGKTEDSSPLLPALKRSWAVTESSSLSGSTPRSSTSGWFFHPRGKKAKGAPITQMKLCGNAVDPPNAPACMDVAIADFIHSHLLPFSLAQDPKLMKIIEEARKLGPGYKPPDRHDIAGKSLNTLYVAHWKEQMKTLLSEARVFGITVFGDGATIKTVPLVNVLASCVNNPFALLEIANCTALAEGGKKDAKYITKIITPLIQLMESEEDMHKKIYSGLVDLVFFDGASNVQNAGEILRAFNPRITVEHGAEHVVSLFFADIYTKVQSFMFLSAFAKRLHKNFGAVRHSPLAMFKKYSRQHNHGVHLGFIKPSECRMAGEHIAILRLLRLKNALLATIYSKEFKDLRVFDSVCQVLMNPDFWKWTFVICRALYAPMQVLRLADQKSAAMDKLNYDVLQTDRMLAMYCKDAEERGAGLLTPSTIRAMDCSTSVGLFRDDSDSDHEESDGVESVDEEDNDDDNGSISAQSDNQNGVDDNISDDGHEQQVPMLLYIAFILCIVQYSNTFYSFILID
jgi:hypothetical protein